MRPDPRLEQYRRAVDYIDREIVRLTPRPRSPEGKVQAALAFNRALGNPQRAYPSIQIAGTSGKGSVAQLLAEALAEAGLRTGCHLSPYLQAFTEKTWVNGRYCSVEQLTEAVEEVRPVAERFRHDDDCPASVHGMASLATSYVVFRDAQLDVAVMETGLGGRYDLVQGLRRKLCIITELGLDHTKALGPTIEEIAHHKAGIMEPGVPSIAVRGRGWGVLESEATLVGAPLQPLDTSAARTDEDGALRLELERFGTMELALGTEAPFVARNVAVVAAALDHLAGDGWPVAAEHLQAVVGSRVPGRFELVQPTSADQAQVILDCAHNAQKMDALDRALDAAGAGGVTLVFTGTGSRAPDDLLRPIAARVERLIATEIELFGKATVAATEVAAAARRLGIAVDIEPAPASALTRALEITPPGGTVVGAGSVYLVGRLRDRWYPTDQVILQGRSWPSHV